ncbi:Iron-binding zinc finger CDGSH type [Actinacidiphila alni]|uniref:Iron-binding zinc finger CDGSH type n=1 Tax=Actinacidiphila alni TaxID=380248 RepID=A0A1I2MF03_9ACTN|nr:CDGSH iron-sulfur domain-containing protein [Actinacidiphila alni]SFF90052.1 Iron-binding zinc finger CDGSH type [Actinacidiphila alni]
MRNTPERPRRVVVERDGPVLVEGPVTVLGDDGVPVTSHRFVVAVCTCRRSRTYPWCDTSHRRKSKKPQSEGDGPADLCPGADEDGAARKGERS